MKFYLNGMNYKMNTHSTSTMCYLNGINYKINTHSISTMCYLNGIASIVYTIDKNDNCLFRYIFIVTVYDFDFLKFYTRGANLHPKMLPCGNFYNNWTDRYSRIADGRMDVRTSHTIHTIKAASYRSSTKNKITTCASVNTTGGTMNIEQPNLLVPPMTLTEAQVVIVFF